MMRVADYILEAIVNEGVCDVFFLPGGGSMHLNNALIKNRDINPISMLHEQGAAIAAEGYARTSGKFGVCMVTSGPGATNAITGLAGALAHVPVIPCPGWRCGCYLQRVRANRWPLHGAGCLVRKEADPGGRA